MRRENITKPNIIIISQYFSPEIFQVNEMAIWLSRKFNVIVIAPFPSYPTKRDIIKSNHNIDNVKIIRTPVITRDGSKLKYVFNQISFLISTIPVSIISAIILKPEYILTAQYSPFTSIVPCFIAKSFTKAKSFIWIFDLWPESIKLILNKNKILNFIYNIFLVIIRKIIGSFDKILISSPSFYYSDSLKNSKDISFLPTWESIEIETKNICFAPKKGQLNICSVGNIGIAHDMVLLESLLLHSKEYIRSFVFLGGGSMIEHLKNYCTINNLYHVKFIGFQSKEKAIELLTKSHYSLVPFKESPIADTIPFRLITSLSVSTPIISFNKTYTSTLIQSEECGHILENSSKKEIELFMNKILRSNHYLKIENANRLYNKSFSPKIIESKLSGLFKINS